MWLPRQPRRFSLVFFTLAALLVFVLSGCSASDPGNTMVPAGDVAESLKGLILAVFWLSVPIFVLVQGLVIYTSIRYRSRPEQGNALPPQIHGNNRLETAWTIAPALIFAIIAVPTIQTIFSASGTPPASAGTPLPVTVIGHQWWWEFDYPDQKIVTADELHIPVGQPVAITVKSADVIHSFWVPRLAGKIDAIPNQTNDMWLVAREAGTFRGQCAEFCGDSHANMRFLVVAESPADFNNWVKQQQAVPVAPTSGAALAGYQTFKSGACVGCHTINGVSAGKVGPNLTHVGSRTTLAGATLDNTPQNLATWLHDPPAVKPGSIMPNLGLSQQQINDLVAYLESLK